MQPAIPPVDDDRATGNVPVWDDAPWASLPSLNTDIEADVCVVGLGGSGLSAVHSLLDMGASVVGIDAATVGGGAAGRNGGLLLGGLASFHHDAARKHGRERASLIYRLTLEQIDRIEQETPEAVRRVGSLRIAASTSEEADCEAHLHAMQADNLPVERYEGPEGKGLLFPLDATFQPLRRCRLLALKAISRGARLYERSRATAVAGRQVRANEGRIRCGAVIVAVDGLLDRLLPELAPLLRNTRLQMLATAPTTDVSFPRPVYRRWGLDYWQQLEDGQLVLGGFRDVNEEGEWSARAEPGGAVQDALEKFLRSELGVSAEITHRWAAIVTYSQTGLPVLAEPRPGVFAAGGYSGTGNVIGALCGRAAAELALSGKSGLAEALGMPGR
jgi:gamma-glutamylputrescine oxidase